MTFSEFYESLDADGKWLIDGTIENYEQTFGNGKFSVMFDSMSEEKKLAWINVVSRSIKRCLS